MYVHCCCLQTPEEGSDLFTDGCETPCGYWDLNSEPSEEQAVLLVAEPSLQLPGFESQHCPLLAEWPRLCSLILPSNLY